MESWCLDSLSKGFVSNETISVTDSVTRNRSELMGMMGWELKPPFSCEDSLLVPSGQILENSCFSEVGVAELVRKQDPRDSMRSVFDDNASVGGFCSPRLVTSNVIYGDDESSSKFSSSIIDSSSRESSLVDMKLGGFGDKLSANSTRTARLLSSDESATPPKRAKVTSLSSQTAYCQVYGCNKDLSSAKDYYKRRKVCDAHSKTPKVIINGIEQRFCQQCSRFHLLGEFDDGKRSCRKRLAGHNERRRKPQVGFSSRCGRSFQPYTGSNLQGFTPTSTSFIGQDVILRGNAHADKNGKHDWVKHIKVKDETGCDQKPAYNCINGQLQPNHILPPYFFEKQSPFIDNAYNTGLQITLGKNVNQYSPDLVSHTLFHTNSLRSENLALLDGASTVKGLPGISESDCALSLLSSQSRNLSGYSSAMPGGHSLLIPSSTSQYSVSEVSEKLFGVGEKALSSEVQNRYPLTRISSTGRNQPSSMSELNNNGTTYSDFGNEIHLNSKFMNIKNHLLCEDGTTIDLLQLSSQLQRVENQRLSEPLKQKKPKGFAVLE